LVEKPDLRFVCSRVNGFDWLPLAGWDRDSAKTAAAIDERGDAGYADEKGVHGDLEVQLMPKEARRHFTSEH
jgi:hypothetical protein